MRTHAAAVLSVIALLSAWRAPAQPADPVDIGFTEEVTVVDRTVPAVNFRRPGSAGTHLALAPTDLVPDEARGEIDVDAKKGYVQVQATAWGLPPAATFGDEYMTYVLWAITPEGRPTNLGELLVDRGSERARLEVTSELQAFGMVVTAEPHFAVTMPSDVVVLENELKAGTDGRVETIDARYELLRRGAYAFRGASRSDLDAPSAPHAIVQARNARRIAEQGGAREHAADVFAKADGLLDQAAATRDRSAGLSLARQAAQSFEDARLLAEERARAEREARARAEAEEAARRAELASREAELASRDRAMAEEDAERARRAAADAEAARADAERARAEAEREKAALRARLLEQMRLIFETRETARGLVMSMPNVLFDFDRATLRPEAREKLARLSGILLSHPGLRLQVEGHADSIGTDAYNQELSLRRAEAVRGYLVEQGVDGSTIGARGLGESQPVASNDTDAGRQQNRRVEIVVSGEVIGFDAAAP